MGMNKFIWLEAAGFLAAAYTTLRIIHFRRLAAFLGTINRETSKYIDPGYIPVCLEIKQLIKRIGDLTPWQNSCFVRAIAAKMMLKRRRLASTLYLGLSKEVDPEYPLSAHAWLRCGQTIITGSRGLSLASYTIIAYFGDERT